MSVPSWVAITLGGAVILAKAYSLLLPGQFGLFAPLFPITTVVACLFAVFCLTRAGRTRHLQPQMRLVYTLFGVALVIVAFAAAGHLVAETYLPDQTILTHQERIVAGLVGLVVVVAGIVALPTRSISRSVWISAFLDLVTVLITGFLAFWLYALSPEMRTVPTASFRFGVMVAHVVVVLLALAALLLAFFRHRNRQTKRLLSAISVAVVLLTTVELLPICSHIAVTDLTQEPAYIGWTLFALCLAVAANPVANDEPRKKRKATENAFVAIPFAATGLVGMLLITSLINRRLWIDNATILLPSIFVALVLVVIRQTRIAHEKLRMAEDMRLAKDIAETANNSRLQFLANISHDLRTPLNGILGCAQILLREKNVTARQRELLRTSQSCAEHLRNLINDLLDLSKLESGRLELAPCDFDLHAFLNELVSGFKLEADNKNLLLELVSDPQLQRWISCDRKRLQQILGNLIHNALKFTSRGSVTARATSSEGSLVFTVKDTGCGIMPDKLSDLFKAFHVVDEKSVQLGGTGLGLSISKKLARKMGGDIEVSSIYGKGSTFTVTLPLTEAAPVVEVQRTIVDYQGHRRRILIVDDNAANRIILQSMLEPLDFLIMEADGGPAALEQLKLARPDVIILDLMMPEMDGFELCRRIQEMRISSSPVCIALSAMAGEDVYDRCRAAGFQDLVRKPVNLELLLESLHANAGIEWVYGLIKPGPKNGMVEDVLPEPTVFPKPQDLAALNDFAMRGNIRGIENLLNKLTEQSSDLEPFAQRARRYVDDFKVKELADWLSSEPTRMAS